MSDGTAHRTAEADAATRVILEVFRANGLILAAGEQLAAEADLTSSRWQVLGAIVLAERPLTVPQIARRMGLTRQSVQSSINRLTDDGLVEVRENPDHRRSVLVQLTDLGVEKYAQVEKRQIDWINQLADGLSASTLETTARNLRELGDRLEDRPATR